MNIRQLRAIIAKIPDDAIVTTWVTGVGPEINLEKVIYSSKRNLARIILDPVALDWMAMERAVDRFDDEEDGEENDD